MSGRRARNDRRQLAYILSEAQAQGIPEIALVDLIRYATKHRELLAPEHFAMVIYQRAMEQYSREHNWKIQNLQESEEALRAIDRIMQAIDLHALLTDKHDLLLTAFKTDNPDNPDNPGNLVRALATLRECAVKAKQDQAVMSLAADIHDRIDCCQQIVAILENPSLRKDQQTKQIKPYIERLQELARESTEYRADLYRAVKAINKGGRTEGMSAWRLWLARWWEANRDNKLPYLGRNQSPLKVRHAGKLQRLILEYIEQRRPPDGLTIEDCRQIARRLEKLSKEPRQVIKALDKDVSEYQREME